MRALRRTELNARAFAPETLGALVAAIDVNDRVDPDAPLPAPARLDYPADRFVEGFRLSRQLWLEGLDRPALIAFTEGVRRDGRIAEETRFWFKQVRARLKHLRFAFFLYSQSHRSPPMLSLLTLVMGELQDAARIGADRDVRTLATRLGWLLAQPVWPLVAREFHRLRPTLSTPQIGAHAFHAARKVVSRQVSFHDDMRTLKPSADHRDMARWLATLNGLMGQVHDDLVARNAAGTFRYARDTFVLSDDIRMRLAALIDLYLGTSSSAPPSA